MFKIFLFITFVASHLFALTTKQEALYKSLNINSLGEALAFYELYGASPEGKAALERARKLFGRGNDVAIEKLTFALNHYNGNPAALSDEEIELIEQLSANFPNRGKAGFLAKTFQELVECEESQIDVGRALLLAEGKTEGIERYLAALDLMALAVNAKIGHNNPTAAEKIAAVNDFLFREKRYRFPAQSVYAKKIDHYTFLSSVIDNHLGVCLGVSSLYLAIAERIGLDLTIVTPPGHIYLRHGSGQNAIVIETTARGADMPEEVYSSINTRQLKERTKKEVVGLSFINLGSVQLHNGDFAAAEGSYRKAALFLPRDRLVQELLGYALVFQGKEEGWQLLKTLGSAVDEITATSGCMTEDLLSSKVDLEGVKALLLLEDEDRDKLLAKKKQLDKTLENYPYFRDGLYQLAAIASDLHHTKEALTYLEKYHAIDATNPIVESHLAQFYFERLDYPKAWYHLKEAENLVKQKGGSDKSLKQLRRELLTVSR